MINAGHNDLNELARVYAAAFADDPVRNWLLPNARERTRRSTWLSLQILRMGLSEGQIFCNTERNSFVMVNSPSDHPPATTLRTVQAQCAAAAALGTGLPRALALKKAMQNAAPKQSHLHLAVCATEPSQQGQGHMRSLFEDLFQQADSLGIPIWLESSNPKNNAIYEHMGFSSRGEIQARPDAPKLTGFLRAPSPCSE